MNQNRAAAMVMPRRMQMASMSLSKVQSAEEKSIIRENCQGRTTLLQQTVALQPTKKGFNQTSMFRLLLKQQKQTYSKLNYKTATVMKIIRKNNCSQKLAPSRIVQRLHCLCQKQIRHLVLRTVSQFFSHLRIKTCICRRLEQQQVYQSQVRMVHICCLENLTSRVRT